MTRIYLRNTHKKEPMKVNIEGTNLMHQYEGLRLQAYKDPIGIWTIGYGNTFYENGKKVRKGDVITKERAEDLFKNIVWHEFEYPLTKLLKKDLNSNQFSALVSFAYNVGMGNVSKSTLLKKVNTNPKNPFIREEFLKWNKADGKVLLGLTRRRQAEANLYFKSCN